MEMMETIPTLTTREFLRQFKQVRYMLVHKKVRKVRVKNRKEHIEFEIMLRPPQKMTKDEIIDRLLAEGPEKLVKPFRLDFPFPS